MVPGERVVVASDQGTRSRLQSVHGSAIRQALMPRILVTGAGGFVGSHLLELLENEPSQITAWLRPGTEPLVRGERVSWIDLEMHDRNAVCRAIAANPPDEIYHL